jgi:hypothetical protein
LHHSEARDVFWQLGPNHLRDGGQDPPTLLWFGLLDHRSEKIPSNRFGEHHLYRKADLFDRLLAFDIQVHLSEGPLH